MQKVFLRLLLLSLSVCMFSCQSNRLEDDVDLLEPNGETGKTYTMYLEATYPSFVGDDADATTRAQNNSWENGDVIYISFTNGNNPRTGEGKFNSSTGKWTIKLDSGSLSETVSSSCRVYYCCDGTVSRSGGTISIDEYSAVFADEEASYTVSVDKEIIMTASIKPQTWRMAFKGEVGTEVSLQPESSIQYINKIDMSGSGGSTIQYVEDKTIDLTVQNTGKTPYIYGVFSNEDNSNSSQLTLQTSQFPSYQFTRSVSLSSLKNGESGIVALPTSTNSDGKWTSKLNENAAVLLDGKEFNAAIKTLAAGTKKSYDDYDESIEFIVFEVNSSISNGTIISNPDSPREVFANYSPATKTISVSTQADKIKTPKDFSNAFRFLRNLFQITGLQHLNTENTHNMSAMFYYCSSLQTLDISNFDTQKVTDMHWMFLYCYSLQTLNISNFDTRNVTNMGYMFCDCLSLQALDVSSFDTSNVTGMQDMFQGCTSLPTLDVSNFDTRNVTDMRYMFSNCHLIPILDVSNFNTHNVIFMAGIFSGCNSLQTLDVTNFDTRNVADMSRMFYDCTSLSTVNLSNLDTRNVTNMGYMFSGCLSLQALDVSSFDTRNVTDMNHMFAECSSLQTLDLGSFDTRNVTNMGEMFFNSSSLQTLDVSSFDTRNVTDMDWMFYSCSSLQTLDLSSFNTQNITTMDQMFANCSSLQSIDLSSFDTQNVTDMQQMFSSCLQLKNLDLRGFQTKNVTTMRDMFKNCQSLETLNLDGFSTESITWIYGMFYQCFALKQLYLGTSFILDKNALYGDYSSIVYGLAESSKKCLISCPAVTKEFFLLKGINSDYIEWEILD